MRVCFYTLGCKVNLNETGALEQMFRANGFTIAQENEPADVFVVNSCTVTNFGDQKSRKWLRRKKRENPGAVTVLTGCYPQAFPEEAAQFTEADLVCGNGDRKAILDNVLKLLDGHERIVAIAPHQRGEQFESAGFTIVPWPETVTTATPLATAAASYTVCCGSPPILQRHAAIVWPSDVSVTSNTQTGPRI